MKSSVLTFTAERKAEFLPQELSAVADGQALVENQVSLLSPGTELALFTRSHIGFDDPEIQWAHYPIQAGYASAGVVLESRIEGLKPGTAVMHYGPHADYSLIGDGKALWAAIPKNLDPEIACFSRFAQIARSAYLATCRPPEKVLVYGAGIVGNLAAQWFNLEGAEEVRITDLSKERLEMASACGITADRENSSPESSFSPDTIVEATGSPGVINIALERVATRGQIILIGSTRGEVTLNPYKHLHRKLVVLSGAHETIQGNETGAILKLSLNKLAEDKLKVSPLITHHIHPEEIPAVYTKILEHPGEYTGILVQWRTYENRT